MEYNDLYSKVWESLYKGRCIGIYPEGGSHDRLELLPLKAGICIMALGAMEKYNMSVKLVPCGFNYYNPQNFRSKAVLEFGPAYEIPMEMVELYRKDKRKAIAILLENVERVLIV
jgi:glycerol-3-phosphate O-acyltransferase/dihydroxyacetone phosphate acyltransferase